jgi:hypothetical protein
MSETLLIYNGRAINEVGKLGLRLGFLARLMTAVTIRQISHDHKARKRRP